MTVESTTRYFAGIDVGRPQDFTAIAVLEQTRVPNPNASGEIVKHYAVRHLKRFPLGTSFPDLAIELKRIFAEPSLNGSPLAVDVTGVGWPVVKLFRQAHITRNIRPIMITAGGGIREAPAGGQLVSRTDLACTINVLLQTRRLRVVESLPDAKVLAQELASFEIKPPTMQNDDALAWREGPRDDLVLAVAIAAWMAERLLEFRVWVL